MDLSRLKTKWKFSKSSCHTQKPFTFKEQFRCSLLRETYCFLKSHGAHWLGCLGLMQVPHCSLKDLLSFLASTFSSSLTNYHQGLRIQTSCCTSWEIWQVILKILPLKIFSFAPIIYIWSGKSPGWRAPWETT